MKINGWEYDFESLPRWGIHDKLGWVTDQSFENEKADVLCLIYSIAEVPMGNYTGSLAILEHKSRPRLLLNVTEFSFPSQIVLFSGSGDLLFLWAQIYRRGKIKSPLIIIDLKNCKFAYLEAGSICGQVKELDRDTYEIQANSEHDPGLEKLSQRKINPRELSWYPWEQIYTLPDRLFPKRRWLRFLRK